METATPKALRFGLMCRGGRLPRWQAETIERLLGVPGVSLELVIQPAQNNAATPAAGGSPLTRVRRLVGSDHTLWDAYNNGYVARRSQSLRPVDCSGMLADVPVIEASPERRGGFSEYFDQEVVQQIRSYDLDFVLRFAYGIIRGDILDVARYGVWSFHHGDEQSFRGSPPAFWEIVTDAPVSGVLLQRLTDRLDGGIVLRKGWVRTTPHSYVRNTDHVHFAGVDFPAQVCRDLLAGQAAYVDDPPSSTEAPIYRKPSDRAVATFLPRLGAEFVRHQLANVSWSDQWNVGVVRSPIAAFLDPDFRPQPEWFPDTRGPSRYLADPFPVPGHVPTAGGTAVAADPHVLAEDFDYANRLGRISRLNFDAGTIAPIDIGTESHASYPFTFEYEGASYLAAQVAGLRGLVVHRLDEGAVPEPAAAIAIPGELLDATLVEHDDRWWLFFTRPGTTSLSELHIWWSHEPFGEWHSHKSNPVKTDIRSARPAGTPFEHQGALYRPAQDCSRTYGGAVALCRIDELTPVTFSETVVRVVEPDPEWPYPHGVHTLSAAGPVTLLDAKRRVFTPHETAAEIRARLRKIRPGRP